MKFTNAESAYGVLVDAQQSLKDREAAHRSLGKKAHDGVWTPTVRKMDELAQHYILREREVPMVDALFLLPQMCRCAEKLDAERVFQDFVRGSSKFFQYSCDRFNTKLALFSSNERFVEVKKTISDVVHSMIVVMPEHKLTWVCGESITSLARTAHVALDAKGEIIGSGLNYDLTDDLTRTFADYAATSVVNETLRFCLHHTRRENQVVDVPALRLRALDVCHNLIAGGTLVFTHQSAKEIEAISESCLEPQDVRDRAKEIHTMLVNDRRLVRGVDL
jgi:hypothetical protein